MALILIRKLPARKDKKGYYQSYAVFWCDFCEQEVEKRLDIGKKAKSCGCVRYKLVSETMKNYVKTEEHRQNLSKALRGRIVSEEEKDRLRNLTKGKKHTEEAVINITKGNIGKNVGKKRTEAQNKRNSEIRKEEYKKGKKKTMLGIHRFGELAPNWSGGKSFEEYGIEFNGKLKQFIKDRDFNICQTPGCMNTENLCVHHIDYNKQNNSLDKLTTLCVSCHAKTNGKNNRQYWTNYYSEIMRIYL